MPPRLPLTALNPHRLPLPALRALPTPLLRFKQANSFHTHPPPLASHKHLEEGDTVSWKHGTGTAAGTVEEIKADGTLEIETGGKKVHKDGDKRDPAVHVHRDGNDVVKLESQLTKEGEHKRGPGRPRKEEGEHGGETHKRGPGRPKKEEHAEGGHEKRGPGRPKKHENEDHNTTPKRGPGRPKKDEH